MPDKGIPPAMYLLIIVGIAALIGGALFVKFFRLWLQAKLSRADV